MTAPGGFLDFFILEAGEYVEQLDGTLLRVGPTGPDPEAIQRLARALRGSATMAKLISFADLAAAVERVARALHDGSVHWEPSLGAALIASVDDLKLLLRSARNWTPADDARAAARREELGRYAPGAGGGRPIASNPLPSGLTYFAAEATNIAAGLDLLITRPDDRETAVTILMRARALRGVAGVKEIADLADVLDGIGDATRSFEGAHAPLEELGQDVVRTGAAVLRRTANELRDGTPFDPKAPERNAFGRAVETWSEREIERERVVPIAQLFYADQGPHVVQRAASPPTSADDRLRLELVSRGEHLRGLLEAVRAQPDQSPDRVRRHFRLALHALATTAESFGDAELGELVHKVEQRVKSDATIDVAAIDALATALADPGDRGERVRVELGRLSAPVRVTPPFVHPPARTSVPTPATPELEKALGTLDAGIAALARLKMEPLATPVAVPQIEIVPIQTLTYRGRSAIERARTLRDDLRKRGAKGEAFAPGQSQDSLDEIFDLLDLALTE